MRGLLCILFAFVWPVAMWLISSSAIGFVLWDNYFVIGLQEWHPLARFMFIISWLIGMIFFILCSLDNDNRDY
jgi:hypothetical protein